MNGGEEVVVVDVWDILSSVDDEEFGGISCSLCCCFALLLLIVVVALLLLLLELMRMMMGVVPESELLFVSLSVQTMKRNGRLSDSKPSFSHVDFCRE